MKFMPVAAFLEIAYQSKSRGDPRGRPAGLSMQWLLSTLVAGFVAFTLTDIDDLLLLIFFFSQTKKSFTKREVLLGQYLGFLFLLLLTTLYPLERWHIPYALPIGHCFNYLSLSQVTSACNG